MRAYNRHAEAEVVKNNLPVPHYNFYTDAEFLLPRQALLALQAKLPDDVVHYPVPRASDAEKIVNAPILFEDSLYGQLHARALTAGVELWPRGGAEFSDLGFDMFTLHDEDEPWVSEKKPGEYITFHANKLAQKTKKVGQSIDNIKDQYIYHNRQLPHLDFISQYKAQRDFRKRANISCPAYFLHLHRDPKIRAYTHILDQPLSTHLRSNLMANICRSAQTSVIYTNHCIRAWMITEAFNSGAEEHVIKDKPRHTSDCAVKTYKKLGALESRSLAENLHCRVAGGCDTLSTTRQQIANENNPERKPFQELHNFVPYVPPSSLCPPPIPPAPIPPAPIPPTPPPQSTLASAFDQLPRGNFSGCTFNIMVGDNYNQSYDAYYYTADPRHGLSPHDLNEMANTPVDITYGKDSYQEEMDFPSFNLFESFRN
ncbi:hypothetical protein CYMTET_34494 [Cymbomonas tetramitiformis]|uniref:Uncharacterized protein n=1 Tax=Cymbomonas tetramitiformis TaxID=36881 RepID=A0AAE0KQ58_9CHLO|nr:hypothetical protein CYMTET_34494 [Cymbomonas tetramitiformis]